MKRNRNIFNSDNFNNSFRKKELKPNYGMDASKVAKLEEIITKCSSCLFLYLVTVTPQTMLTVERIEQEQTEH